MIIDLHSVGSVIDSKTLIVYPSYNEVASRLYNKVYDDTWGTHIADCCEEFKRELNEEDSMLIKMFYPQLKK